MSNFRKTLTGTAGSSPLPDSGAFPIETVRHDMRDTSLDISKGIGISLVVYGHSWLVLHEKSLQYEYIYSFHVPLFLFISGLFFSVEKSLLATIKDKLDAVVKPYLVIAMLAGILPIASGATSLETYFSLVFIGTGESIGKATGYSIWTPLWFLPHLFLIYLYSWISLRTLKARTVLSRAALVGASLLGGYCAIATRNPANQLLHPIGPLPLSLDLLLLSTSFFWSGHYLRKTIERMDVRWMQLCLCAILFVYLHLRFGYTMDLNLRKYDNLPVSTLQAALGIYLVLGISKACVHVRFLNSVLSTLGRGSLFVLMFHWPFQAVVFHALLRWHPENELISAMFALACGLFLPLLALRAVRMHDIPRLLFLPFKNPKPQITA